MTDILDGKIFSYLLLYKFMLVDLSYLPFTKKSTQSHQSRNSGEGTVLVRIKPTRILAEKDTAVLD
ncbi:MAG: hypothetical protein WBZ36_17430 [Candidatus Nitrosopolaris sp.]